MLSAHHVSAIALAAGLTLSPDTLTLFGNGLGAAWGALFLVLVLGICIHLGNIQSFRELHETSGDAIAGIRDIFGGRTAAIVLLCGKLPFAVCASAGLVVSAGFVFNEVFVYWFPNFTFAYLLLVATLILNLPQQNRSRCTNLCHRCRLHRPACSGGSRNLQSPGCERCARRKRRV